MYTNDNSLPIPQYNRYTVAWICALYIEMAAARAMLDEIHETLPRNPEDTNSYVLGSIQGHNIVVACLPISQYGTNNAAMVATNLKRTFPGVCLGLMVGIGGGVPAKADIRLGDIVVGTSIVQYDLGKIMSDGKFERTAIPRTHDLLLGTTVANLRSKHEHEPSRVTSILQQKFKSNREYNRPIAPDRLFQVTYEHQSQSPGCDECDQSKLITRSKRISDPLKIHYGAIASGNQVMKHGATRDNVARELDVMCFEMEAAGLLNVLPILPIRGICDYSDSHKSKEWQKYAAATAAAYARELIEELPIPKERARCFDTDPHQLIDNEILGSLAFPQMMARRDNIEACYENTCKWILALEDYKSWKSHPRGLLWIKGKPGAGKSTLMSFLYDDLKALPGDSQSLRLEFFFTARGTELQRTQLGMLRSLLNQIFARDETIRPQVREAYTRRCEQFGYGVQQWEWPQRLLEDLLVDAILASASRQSTTLFVDALDEAGVDSAQQLAGYFHRLNNHAEKSMVPVKICISCRHYPIMNHQATEIKVEDHNHEDIAAYIKDKLRTELMVGSDPDSDPDAWQGLINDLIQQANGVFQWASVIIPIIQRKIQHGDSPRDIRDWVPKVPAQLGEVYKYILCHVIDFEHREQSFLLFQWLCLAERPLTVTEMRYAMAAKDADITLAQTHWSRIKSFVETDYRMKLRVKLLSGGLAETVSNDDGDETIQVVHQSVNDFFYAEGLAYLNDLNGDNNRTMNVEEIIFQCQATLYRSCLIYFITAEMSQKRSLKMRESYEKNLAKNSPLLRYTTIYLFVHGEKAGRSRRGVIRNEIPILERWIDCWVKAYQRLSEYSTACPVTDTTLLHMASAANMVDVIDGTVSNSPIINKKNKQGQTALHLAAARGHMAAAERLQAKGADLEARDRYERTPLVEAASHGHIEFVEWLLCFGAAINTSTGSSGNALQSAASKGQSDIVRILLGAGAEINVHGGDYGSALQAAARHGRVEVVQMLLDAGADVNIQGGMNGNALQAAARHGRVEVVQILLDAGADVNIQGGVNGNALQAAAWHGSVEVVQILLDAGADVSTQGGECGNALQAAALGGSAKVVQILLDAGADVSTQGGEYGNVLQAAARHGSVEVVQVLLNAGADVNSKGGVSGNALQAAAWHGSVEVVQILLDAGADVNTQGGENGNALQAAALCGSAKVVQILLDADADISTQGGRFGSALQAASFCGSVEIVQILLDAGADVSAQGGEYGNALQAAVYQGYVHMVQLLLDSGSDPSLLDGMGRTPLHIAASTGLPHILQKFPSFISAMNLQDRLLRSPLHVAVYHGNFHFALILLEHGADPCLKDGFGRNCLDLALDHRDGMIIDHIHHFCPAITLTPQKTQKAITRQSIHRLSSSLLRSTPRTEWPLLEQLGHYLMFLDELNDAYFLFQLHLHHANLGYDTTERMCYGICDCRITRSRFVCRLCPYTVTCSIRLHTHSHRGRVAEEHELLKVSLDLSSESLVEGSIQEQLNKCLKIFVCRYREQNYELVLDIPNGSSPTKPKKAVAKGIPLGRIALASTMMAYSKALTCPLLFCIPVGLLASWYFCFRRSKMSP